MSEVLLYSSHMPCIGATHVERIWQVLDRQGQILAVVFRKTAFKSVKLFPRRSEAEGNSPTERMLRDEARSHVEETRQFAGC